VLQAHHLDAFQADPQRSLGWPLPMMTLDTVSAPLRCGGGVGQRDDVVSERSMRTDHFIGSVRAIDLFGCWRCQANAGLTTVNELNSCGFKSTSDRRSCNPVRTESPALAFQPFDGRKRDAGSLGEMALFPAKESPSCPNEFTGQLSQLDTFIAI
jgi:hypothetical protein